MNDAPADDAPSAAADPDPPAAKTKAKKGAVIRMFNLALSNTNSTDAHI